jgi:hypothetical protein
MVVKIPWWDKLNNSLRPYIGPPPLGPYGEAELPPVAASGCPICGRIMAEHDIERREGRPTKVHCPV